MGELPDKRNRTEMGESGITVSWEFIADRADMTIEQVKKFAKENPNAFAGTIAAGPVGYLIGRHLDQKEKKKD